ncbi:MAG: ADOP family duplicated permease, partial [Vicinamibacterales bacterium]
MMLRALVRRLLALARSRRLESELDDEVRAHLELAERDALAAGLSPAEARRTARLRFGNVDRIREEHRDTRSVRWMETLAKDFRYGLLLLRRDPVFAIVAIAVMAIGIGANTAMFSLMDAVLLKPLPYPEPERMVRVWEAPTPTSRNGISTLNFVDWKRLSTSFEALSAVRGLNVALTGEGDPARLAGVLVSADYFEVFGVNAALGRTFVPDDEQPGANKIVVLNHATWQARFGGDRTLLNRTIDLDGEPHEVVGILPPGSFDRGGTGFWKPIEFAPDQRTRGYHWLGAVGRLKAGVTLGQAREEMRGVSASLKELQPAFKRDWSVTLDPFDQDIVRDNVRQSMLVAFGAVVMVLLIASANIANLLLAKGVARRKEMAVRAALGASGGRLAAQVLTESLVLCLLGGIAGVALAHLLLGTAVPMIADTLPSTATVVMDLRVLAFAAATAVVVSLLVGLLPAIQLSRGQVTQGLNLTGRGTSSRDGARRAIVIAEVAVSLVLICGAVLLFRSLFKLQRVDPGVRIDNVITMSADLPLATYPDPDRASRFIEDVAARLQAIPGVENAAVSTDIPMLGVRQGDAVSVPGVEGGIGTRFKRVDPHYFGTLDIPVLAGRGFTTQDRAGAPRVVVVNEALARQLADRFKLSDPAGVVGRIVRITAPMYENRGQTGKAEDMEVIGMIRNERIREAQAPIQEVVYVSVLQAPRRELKLLVRTRNDAPAAMPAIRAAVGEVDPRLPLGDIRTMEQVKQLTLSGSTEPAWIIGVFAGLAALLAALGLYGVLSHAVTQRRREIGIRMALGANAADVLAHVLRNAAWMVIVGLVAGLAGALALTRVMKTILFEVSALDPLAFTVAAMAMALVGLAAALVPA